MDTLEKKLNTPITLGSLIVIILIAIVLYLYVFKPQSEKMSYTSGATMRFLQKPTATNMGDGREMDSLDRQEDFTYDKPPGAASPLQDQINSEEELAKTLYEGMQNTVEPDLQAYNELHAINRMF